MSGKELFWNLLEECVFLGKCVLGKWVWGKCVQGTGVLDFLVFFVNINSWSEKNVDQRVSRYIFVLKWLCNVYDSVLYNILQNFAMRDMVIQMILNWKFSYKMFGGMGGGGGLMGNNNISNWILCLIWKINPSPIMLGKCVLYTVYLGGWLALNVIYFLYNVYYVCCVIYRIGKMDVNRVWFCIFIGLMS